MTGKDLILNKVFFYYRIGNSAVLCGYLCSWLLRGSGCRNVGAVRSVIKILILFSVLQCFSIIQSVPYLFVFFTCILTGNLHTDQMSLIPPLPPILLNQSSQEMIMTHCLSNTSAPDASDVTCLSVYNFTLCTVLSSCVCNITHCASLIFT